MAHEFAYQGVKVLTAGDNPCAAYDFCYHPKTKDEFEKQLLNIGNLPIEISKEKIEEFFYMHYLYKKKNQI